MSKEIPTKNLDAGKNSSAIIHNQEDQYQNYTEFSMSIRQGLFSEAKNIFEILRAMTEGDWSIDDIKGISKNNLFKFAHIYVRFV